MLDQHIQRLQNLTPFNIYSIAKGGVVAPWYEVTGAIVHDLVLKDQEVGTQVQTISAQIALWSRLTAQARRVWEIEERNLRVWKARRYMESSTPDGTKDWKKPTEKAIESAYRVHPEYGEKQNAVERAEEAFLSAQGIVAAFTAKREMIKIVVWKNRENSQPELTI